MTHPFIKHSVERIQREIAMSKPEDVTDEAWEFASEAAQVVFDASVDLYEIGKSGADPQLVIARAIMAAEKRGEEREREACAAIIDANMLCGDDRSNKEVLLPRGTSGNKVGVAYAAAIRARSA